MEETPQKVVIDDTKVAAEITEALQTTQPDGDAETTTDQPEAKPETVAAPTIDVDALARALRDAEERGYQRALAEAENARQARQQRTFAMPASDSTPPTSTPTILNGLKPGFWER